MGSKKDILLPYQSEVLNDEPISICGLKLKPVKMRDYVRFNNVSGILKIEKNKSHDPKFISMSYLEFLIHLMINTPVDEKFGLNIYQYMVGSLFDLVLEYDKMPDIVYGFDEKEKPYLKVGDIVLHKKDFDKIKDIILYQNIPSYDDEYINPELEEELAKVNELRSKGAKLCDIEKQEIAVVIGSSLTFEDVRNMTIRKFMLTLEMIDKKLHYIMAKQASWSGFVTFKEDITHYLYEKEETLEDRVMSYTDLKNKING